MSQQGGRQRAEDAVQLHTVLRRIPCPADTLPAISSALFAMLGKQASCPSRHLTDGI